ncbi:MAG: ABC transporter substrate-binding protein [Chloroflexi bacterium]|nr:ABC transporter substrate-binding protein [Chloroflexota bacterium]
MKRQVSSVALLIIGLCLVSPVVAFDCADPLGCVEVAPGDTIVLGAMLTYSGANAFFGEDSLGGIELAILDRGGEVLGREIELTGADDQCTSEGGQAAGQRMASDRTIVGIIGPSCTSAAQGALPIISEAGMLTISPTNTAPELTNADTDSGGAWRPGYYRITPNDRFQGLLVGQFAYRVLGARRVATVHDGGTYTESLTGIMRETFLELGGEVVFTGSINVGDVDMTAVLTEVAASGPDILFAPFFPPESEFITAQMASISGLEDTVIMVADASLVNSYAPNTGEAALGAYLSGPNITGEKYETLLKAWEDEFGGRPPSSFHAHAYDATNLVLNAVEKVAIEADDGTLFIGRQAMREAISAVENYDGVTGNLTCLDESPYAGDCGNPESLAVFEITEAVLYDGLWPPPAVWDLSMLPEES